MNENVIEDAFGNLPGSGRDMIQGRGEYMIWRHQKVGQRRHSADNAMGMAPDEMAWETDDRVVQAAKQGLVFYGQFVPIEGDVLERLRGNPQTAAEARQAEDIGSYGVKDVETRYTDDGELAYARIETVT